MDDRQFRQILDWFRFSWEGYRKVRKGVKKRLVRHMQQLGRRTVNEYLAALSEDPALKAEAERLLTVSISRFFRDRALWEVLEVSVVPAIIRENRKRVRVWSAGCACGEEPYSFKILWDVLCDRIDPAPELELWATDMSPLMLEKARIGVYSKSSLKEVSEALKTSYFVTPKKGPVCSVADSVKEGIHWRRHHLLLDDPPRSDFHLVFLRNNLLTYYQSPLRDPAFERILRCLMEGGFLVVGSHEKPPPHYSQLIRTGLHPLIYVKRKAT